MWVTINTRSVLQDAEGCSLIPRTHLNLCLKSVGLYMCLKLSVSSVGERPEGKSSADQICNSEYCVFSCSFCGRGYSTGKTQGRAMKCWMIFRSIDLLGASVLFLPNKHRIPWKQQHSISSVLIKALVKGITILLLSSTAVWPDAQSRVLKSNVPLCDPSCWHLHVHGINLVLEHSVYVPASCWNAASEEPTQTVSGVKLPWHSPVCSARHRLRNFLPCANEGALSFSLDSAGDQLPGFGINCSVWASPPEN